MEVSIMKRYIIIAILILSILTFGCAEQDTGKISGTTKKVVAEPPKVYEPAEKESVYVEVESPEPEPAEPELSGEEKAVEIVREYVKNMGGYRDQMGRGMKFQIPVSSGCEGCWIVDVTFSRDLLHYPEKEEIVKMSAYLKDWKVDRYDFS